MEKKDNWLFDTLFPIMHYRLARSMSYGSFIQNILVQRNDCGWRIWRASKTISTYSLCYRIGRNDWSMFTIGAKEALTEQDVAFYASPKKKEYVALAHGFDAKTLDGDVCHIVDLVLPTDAILQIKDIILHRQDNEELELGTQVVLFPKETCEEVLVECDLASRV